MPNGLTSRTFANKTLVGRVKRVTTWTTSSHLGWEDLRLANDLVPLRMHGATPTEALTVWADQDHSDRDSGGLQALESLERLLQMSLIEECNSIVACSAAAAFPTETSRNTEILRSRLLYTAGEANTLMAIGDRFGMTRERIRQIEARGIEPALQRGCWSPIGDFAIEELRSLSPCPTTRLKTESILASRLVATGQLESFLRFRKALQKTGQELAVAQINKNPASLAIFVDDQASIAKGIHAAAKQIARIAGGFHIEQVIALASQAAGEAIDPNIAESWLRVDPELRPLQSAPGWWWFGPQQPSRLMAQIEKILCVLPQATTLSPGGFYEALCRERRPELISTWDGRRIPEKVLSEIISAIPGVAKTSGDHGDPEFGNGCARDPEQCFTRVELGIFHYMVQRNGTVSRASLRKRIPEALGCTVFAVDAVVSGSPMFHMVEPAIIHLLGWPINADALRDARLERGPHGTFSELFARGMERDLKICQDSMSFVYSVSSTAIKAGQVCLPRQALPWLVGTGHRVFSVGQGTGATLRVTSKEQSYPVLTGLRSTLKSLSVQIGQPVLITLNKSGLADIREHQASVLIDRKKG